MKKLIFALLIACAHPQTGVQGGDLVPYNEFTGRPVMVLTPSSCRKLDGTPVRTPDGVEYELFQKEEVPVLLVHTLSEQKGRLVHNRWVADDGLHYFVWMSEASGIEFVVPSRPEQPGQRRQYRHLKLRTSRQNGREVVQPVGQPEEVCDLMAMK